MSESLTDALGTDNTASGRLRAAQTNAKARWTLTVAATLIGLTLASLHWGGILVGGALVGCCWPTLRRALVAGLAFGLLVILAALVQFGLAGSLDEFLAMGPLALIHVVVPLAAGPLGAAARGLCPDASR